MSESLIGTAVSHNRRLAVTLAAVLVAAVAGAGAQEQPPTERFSGAVSVDVVTVDVVISDHRGRPVTGLERGDFRVFEDGVEMELSNFAAVSLDAPAAVEAAGALEEQEEVTGGSAPAERPGHLIIYLDLAFMRTQSARRLLPKVADFLREQVPPGTRVMLATYDGAVDIPVPFTDDLDEVIAVLEKEVRRAGAGNLTDAFEYRTLHAWAMAENQAQSMSDGGAMSSGEALAIAQEERQVRLDALAEDYRAMIRRAWRNLRYFVDSFAGLAGRKVMLYVSDGVPSRPDFWDSPTGSQRADGRRPPPFGTAADLIEVVAHASSLGITIHTVYGEGAGRWISSGNAISSDVPGRVAFGRSDQMREMQFNMDANSTTTLQLLAEGTGGLAVLKATPQTMAPLGADVRNYYSLGYRPPTPGDGAVHSIRVEVDRKKVSVRHRARYISLAPRARASATAIAALISDRPENPLGVAWDVPAAGQATDGGFRVPVHVRIPILALAMQPDGDLWRGQIRAFLVAQDLEGALAPIRELTVPLEIKELPEAGSDAVFLVPASIDLPAGEHTVAVTVLDELSGAASSVTTDLFVDSSGGVWKAAADG